MRRTDIVCDIGAHKGSYLFWLSRWCADGRVVAFEPQPLLADYLSRVCAPLKNVKIEPRAVYSTTGTQTLVVPGPRSPGATLGRAGAIGETLIPVETVSLDDYFSNGERISLLKIDVEGAELEVFKGAERILREQAPLLVFECEGRHIEGGSVKEVFSYLEALGYSGRFICGYRARPVSEFDAAIHQRAAGPYFWKKPGYYNNFIFSKAGSSR